MPFGKINGMELQLDKSGRIVLPKPLRQRLGVKAGSKFVATEAAEGLLLKPVILRPSLVKRNGLLVHTGVAPRGFSWKWEDISEDLGQERLREIFGRG